MWTYKLHRTKDGASVTVPKEVLRLWEPYRVQRVRVELALGGRLTLIPYTDSLELVHIPGSPAERVRGD